MHELPLPYIPYEILRIIYYLRADLSFFLSRSADLEFEYDLIYK
jgi:hypothetical protein